MKKFNLNLLATMILVVGAFAFTACSSSDDDVKDNELTIEKLVGVWVTDYSQSGTEGDLSWNRVVEDYKFDADGTGYYECYRLDGEKYVDASSVRDNDSLHFTISGNTVTITGDKNNMKQTLSYADGKLTVQGKALQKATADQVAFIHQLYAEWQGGNAGTTVGITYISRSWDGTKVVDKEVTVKAKWLNKIQIAKGYSRYMGEKSEEGLKTRTKTKQKEKH